jgi:hypothetical protein
MVKEPTLIIQLPRGSVIARQLSGQPPRSVASGEVVVQGGPTDAQGHLEASAAGRVVLSLPSPEALEREAVEVRRAIGQSGTGVEPLIVAVEAAEQLREEELDVLLDAARRSSRAVILRIIRDA